MDIDFLTLCLFLGINTILYMKKVTQEKWKDAATNLQNRRASGNSGSGADLYKRILNMVHVGKTVLDVGCGSCYLKTILPEGVTYKGIDPFPTTKEVRKLTAEELKYLPPFAQTVFMMSALDNVQNLKEALEGLKKAAIGNIVILTGIGIDPDQYHTVRVDREDLIEVLGEPHQEIYILPKVYLFEFFK